MHDNSFLPNYGDDDVCYSSDNAMFKVGKLREKIKEAFRGSVQTALNDVLKSAKLEFYTHGKDWLGDGIDCEILKIGAKGWQKGKIKIRVSVEFCPDEPEITEPESPLDDIRRKINEVSI
ncbi:KGK domain protein [Hassallia byssoidea VB512170]|uniref:KGK domain protein n=1 Tax=Hassallia byssoidea VB512170 TaxID=1304833 RepID=A0A846H5W3_9CYAN|nr:KGK domain-containing protein [Hassalia byssoidea]NEU72786.1 KGK domain protein [Hassalia byssoidea VB512170]